MPAATGNVLPYLTYLFSTLFIYELYPKVAEWDVVQKYAVHVDALPLLLCPLPEPFATIVGSMRPRPEAQGVAELLEDDLQVHAHQLQKHFVSSVLQALSAVNSELSCAAIGTRTIVEILQIFHVEPNTRRN